MMLAQTVKDIPGVQAAIMPIGKNRTDRVVANRFNAQDIHIAFADLQGFLAWPVSTCLGRGGEYPQELEADLEALAADGKARGRLLDGGPATVAGGAQPGGGS